MLRYQNRNNSVEMPNNCIWNQTKINVKLTIKYFHVLITIKEVLLLKIKILNYTLFFFFFFFFCNSFSSCLWMRLGPGKAGFRSPGHPLWPVKLPPLLLIKAHRSLAIKKLKPQSSKIKEYGVSKVCRLASNN